MSRIAVDVVLLPPEFVMEKAIQLNRELLKSNEKKIILSSKNCIPHISLAMGCISEGNRHEIENILGSIISGFPAIQLKAESIAARKIPPGILVSQIVIQKTVQIQELHNIIMEKLRLHFDYDANPSMFHNPLKIGDFTLNWVKNYARHYRNPKLFHPHITLGIGKIKKPGFPLSFFAKRLAICQLGNYCTCRKILAEFELKERNQESFWKG